MLENGKFYVVFRKPDFFSELALSHSDMNALVEAQMLQKKFNDGLSANIVNLGGTSIDAGHFTVLDMPIGSLQNILNIQNAMEAHIPFGLGSTIDGAYKALMVAHKYQKRLELYVPDRTEALLNKSEDRAIQDAVLPMATEEEINDSLLAEIQAKAHEVDPQQFFGLISEFQQILQNFKINLPTFETMQLTNPAAYGSILDVVNAASQFAQILMQSGVLNTDLGILMEQQAQQQEQEAAGQEEGGDSETPSDSGGSDEAPTQKTEEPTKKKATTENPVGTVKISGTTFRVKTKNGWKYASRGLGSGEGGEAIPGTGAGTDTEGVQEPVGPSVVEPEAED